MRTPDCSRSNDLCFPQDYLRRLCRWLDDWISIRKFPYSEPSPSTLTYVSLLQACTTLAHQETQAITRSSNMFSVAYSSA